MFGTIGRARLKPGARAQLESLMADWNEQIRPKIPGSMLNLLGNAAGSPDDLVFVALVQDEPTYRNLANLPEQDAWFRRMAALIEGEVSWEDVELTAADES